MEKKEKWCTEKNESERQMEKKRKIEKHEPKRSTNQNTAMCRNDQNATLHAWPIKLLSAYYQRQIKISNQKKI